MLLLCSLLSFAPHRAQAQVAHLTLHSEVGDYIGQGQDYDVTYTLDNSYYFSAQIRRTVAGLPAELLFVLGSGPTTPFALLFFGTDQLGIPMQPGVYTNAQRADFASPGHPGLDVSFQNRGSNTLTGQFTVTNFVYSPTAGVQSFTASFEQHSEGATPALFGTFTYLAVVPEPSTVALCALSLTAALGWWARHRAKRNRTVS